MEGLFPIYCHRKHRVTVFDVAEGIGSLWEGHSMTAPGEVAQPALCDAASAVPPAAASGGISGMLLLIGTLQEFDEFQCRRGEVLAAAVYRIPVTFNR